VFLSWDDDPRNSSMIRRLFESEHDDFRATARRFFEKEIGPHASQWREDGIVARAAFEKAGKCGFLLMWANARYGGAGVDDFRYEQILIEENARYGERGFYLTLHSRLVAPYIDQLGTPELRDLLIPRCVRGETILAIAMTEPDAGSDLAGMRTRAIKDGRSWVINGSKTYISNGQLADAVVVAAKTDPASKRGIGLFLVESGMPGYRRGRRLKKMGLDAQDTSELFFDDVRVPESHVLGDPGLGFSYLTRLLPEERLITAVGSIAYAQQAFDLTRQFVRGRKVFGRVLGSLQNTRFQLATLGSEIDCLQTFVDTCVIEHNRGALTPVLAAEAKLLASELEGRVVDQCLQLHGGAGYMDEYPISRMYRDARVSRIFAGSSEIMREIIARDLDLEERQPA
jgi:alkylation response protein AidB-like acyl-CoA dehydrogenase